jgi:hypothetical protein
MGLAIWARYWWADTTTTGFQGGAFGDAVYGRGGLLGNTSTEIVMEGEAQPNSEGKIILEMILPR